MTRIDRLHDATGWLHDHAFDVVVVNIEHVDADALARIREVSRRLDDGVLIVRGDHDDPAAAAEVLAAGADDFIPADSPDAVAYSIRGSLHRRESSRLARRLAAIVDSSSSSAVTTWGPNCAPAPWAISTSARFGSAGDALSRSVGVCGEAASDRCSRSPAAGGRGRVRGRMAGARSADGAGGPSPPGSLVSFGSYT